MELNTKKEAARKKSLGELGELFALKALVDNGYKVSNLNDRRMNFPFADLLAEKDGIKYIISVKSRNMLQKNNTLNSSYKLGDDVYDKIDKALTSIKAVPCWLAVQFERQHYSIYFGLIQELEGKKRIPINKCMQKEIGQCLAHRNKHFFDFDYFENQKELTSVTFIASTS
jgi:Holliday junction resolvase-like predicted endonuclease